MTEEDSVSFVLPAEAAIKKETQLGKDVLLFCIPKIKVSEGAKIKLYKDVYFQASECELKDNEYHICWTGPDVPCYDASFFDYPLRGAISSPVCRPSVGEVQAWTKIAPAEFLESGERIRGVKSEIHLVIQNKKVLDVDSDFAMIALSEPKESYSFFFYEKDKMRKLNGSACKITLPSRGDVSIMEWRDDGMNAGIRDKGNMAVTELGKYFKGMEK